MQRLWKQFQNAYAVKRKRLEKSSNNLIVQNNVRKAFGSFLSSDMNYISKLNTFFISLYYSILLFSFRIERCVFLFFVFSDKTQFTSMIHFFLDSSINVTFTYDVQVISVFNEI